MSFVEKLRARIRNFAGKNSDSQELVVDNPFLLLSPEMRETVEWIPQNAPTLSSMETTVSGQLWKDIPGGHKWLDYFEVYDKEFSRFRNKSPKVLEIGVYKGASLNLWKQFFGTGATIVGIDIDPSCIKFNSPDDGIFVEIGSQADVGFLEKVATKHGPFDLIIDDGSHVASHQIASFNALFIKGLRDGGLYFVEDLECIYWGHTSEFRDQRLTSIDFFKMLIDIQNEIFTRYEYNDFALHVGIAANSYKVSKIIQHLGGVKFFRGIAAIEKKKKNPPLVLHI